MELFFLLLLVVIMAYALGSGYPVAFALPGSAIIAILLAAGAGYLFTGDTDAYFESGGPSQWLSAGVTNLRGVYWEPERDTLIAIPLFIFMGIMLQRSKIAEDLLVTMAQLFGPVPGGLGISVVVVGALLAATTGIVGATVVAMGLISLPAMMRNGYANPLSTGIIASSGTLGQIIPPSIVLIILADQLSSAVDQAGQARQDLYKEVTGELVMPSEYAVVSTSAGDMFLGAMVPGLVLVGLYILFILTVALIRPKLAPAVPYDDGYDLEFLGRVLLAMVPPLALIVMVLGSIIGGIATVNQAGAIGAIGALVMAGYRLHPGGRLQFVPAILTLGGLAVIAYVLANYDTNVQNIQSDEDAFGVNLAIFGSAVTIIGILWSGYRAYVTEDALTGVMVETAKTTSLVFIILLGAAMLTAAFRAFGGEELVKHFLEGLPGGFWTKFFIVMVVIFVLGFFLDFIEIAVVVVPIVAPILLADPEANVTAVWLGVMIGLNIQTSFLTPPFGFALFYLRGVASSAVKTIQIYIGVLPFIGLQLFSLLIVASYPPLVNYLPMRSSLTAETAPPPINPALQYCVENYVAETFETEGDRIRGSIDRMESVDISYLPRDPREDFNDGLENAREAFTLMAEIERLKVELAEQAVDYRPVHTVVRQLEAEARRIEDTLEELRTQVSRGFGETERLQARVDELEAERENLLSQVPESWDAAEAAYGEITSADRRARTQYRRTVDQAYEPVMELREMISDTSVEALAALEAPVEALAQDARGMDGETADTRFKDVERMVGDVAGGNDIRGLLSDARREIDARTPNAERALEYIAEAQEMIAAELAWRSRAQNELLPELEAYDQAIQGTIGLRQQPRLPKEQALFIASCNAEHRDISLNF
ncbi:Sialic acid TRAP transporter permease protein SiaT [Roseivivax sp. THAF40]|uniref:TRAP transporter large permease subunit n=1 Tax=unclassified Roseivivax TaxID=2639302 RepID=UPI001268DEA1|nr:MULTISPECIES: TRAP transporter large permease subunit [unclassified Roseivivax]QFS83660.1 Sialic acid TRAP transporter permease protein SiaT [Roseivivax sp. THAF197b]QFT47468.1 Sialic acid TRAP transporter permease protein SiaT [Roseivivax sp. THAF40]